MRGSAAPAVEIYGWNPRSPRRGLKPYTERATSLGWGSFGCQSDWDFGQPDGCIPVCPKQHGTTPCQRLCSPKVNLYISSALDLRRNPIKCHHFNLATESKCNIVFQSLLSFFPLDFSPKIFFILQNILYSTSFYHIVIFLHFSFNRTWRTNLSKGACALLSSSVDHERAPILGVRVNVLLSRYLIEPCSSGKSKLTYMCRIDLRWTFHFVIFCLAVCFVFWLLGWSHLYDMLSCRLV